MRQVLALISLVALGTPAIAQTVDSEGAKRLADTLSKYVGVTAFEKRIVKVAADGDAYELEVDLDALVGVIPKQDMVTFDFTPYALRIKPRADGTWDVAGNLSPGGRIEISALDQKQRFEWTFSGDKFAGLFDPKLATFANAEGSFGAMTMTTVDANQTSESRYGASTITMKSAASPTGGVSISSTQVTRDISETHKFNVPESGLDFAIVLKAPRLAVASNLAGFKYSPILDLLAFGVANADLEKIKARQGELKRLLLAALPLWDRMDVDYGLEDVSVQTPFGTATAGRLGFAMALGGISQDGSLSYGFRIADLKVPTQALPAWTAPLLLTDLDLNIGAADIDLNRPARRAIEAFDLNQVTPVSEEVAAEIGSMFLADPPRIVMKPSFARTRDSEIAMQGEMSFAGGKPTMNATFDVSGFDKIVEVLQAGAVTDPQAQQALPVALAVKGFAKTQADGRLQWVVETKPDGAVLVNGTMVKGADPVPTPEVIAPE